MPIINYCSLDEAWGNEYADLYKQQFYPSKNKSSDYDDSKQEIDTDKERDVMLPRKTPRCDKDDEITGLYRKKTEQKKKAGSGLTCDDFIEHFRNCDKCKKELRGNDIKEGFSGISGITGKVDYIDLIIIFLIGIIIIFILDCIVRVGKKIK